jgi:hypothetical protein
MINSQTKEQYYIGNQVFKKLTVSVLGQEQELKVSDVGQGIIGIVYVYDNEELAKIDNGDGYTKAVAIESEQL